MNIKKEFKMLSSNLIYLDNAATTFKPNIVLKEMNKYYTKYCANAHRGDYKISHIVNDLIDDSRKEVAKFINSNTNEIIFTSGTTESINIVVSSFFSNILKKGDEILTTKAEHSSLLLPLFELAKKNKLKIKYITIDKNNHVTLDNIKKEITSKTKLIALAHITNVLGDIRPVKEIGNYASKHNIYTLIDAAQSIGHIKVDIKDTNIDFMAFSAHKMYGPTGIGILFGKEKLLEKLGPYKYGGDMNASYDSNMNIEYKNIPTRLEAGTQNIVGIIGLNAAIKYINKIGIEQIYNHDKELRTYLVDKLKKIDNIKIYNPNEKTGIVTFNIDKVFCQDVAVYLDKKNVCIRAGSHCAKILHEIIKDKNTCRVSIGIYNTKKDIDILIKALENKNILKESL
ncbi:MAG TPA: cysteine desulfurase [Bacilli bacterium]|nr:cysteine desulfurase [Bacilli bacterium]